MPTIYIVTIANSFGDEPEVWAFESEIKAEGYAEARMATSLDAIAKPQSLPVLDDREADEAIEHQLNI